MNFSDLGLSPEVLTAVNDSGYTVPTPIQEQAIPYVLMGRDVLGCAQTGTGKTAGFTLPMIDILSSGRARARMPRSLIIAPTRELAAQVSENFEKYGKHGKLSMALLIGGSSFVEQEKKLDRGVDVLIATPGRLLDLFERGKILLADVKILVIDEADRMLDMGFIPDVERIVSLLPKIRQTLFFSATMAPEIRRLADAFLINPKEISVDPPASAALTVTQALVKVSGDIKSKRAVLRSLIRSEEVKSGIVFCNRKRDVDIVFKSLKQHGFSVAALHGDMAQPVRMETLENFKKAVFESLVCSDVAARGLDIPAVSHVFNFDVPINAEDYVHRIGRTGRAGRSGKAFMLAFPEESRSLAGVISVMKRDIPIVEIEGFDSWGPDEASDGRGRKRRSSSNSSNSSSSSRRSEPRARRTAGPRPDADSKSGASLKVVSDRDVDAAEQPQEQPQEPEAGAAVAETPKPRRQPVAARAKPRAKAAAVSAQDGNDDDADDGRGGSAFGDHTPAFMLRPAQVA
jgi:superfamily II DNA/RNA helicase